MRERKIVDNTTELQQKLTDLREELEEIVVEVQCLQTTIEITHEAGEDTKDLVRLEIEKIKRASDLIADFCRLTREG